MTLALFILSVAVLITISVGIELLFVLMKRPINRLALLAVLLTVALIELAAIGLILD